MSEKRRKKSISTYFGRSVRILFKTFLENVHEKTRIRMERIDFSKFEFGNRRNRAELNFSVIFLVQLAYSKVSLSRRGMAERRKKALGRGVPQRMSRGRFEGRNGRRGDLGAM